MLKVLSIAELACAGVVAASDLPRSQRIDRVAAIEVGNLAQRKEVRKGGGGGNAGPGASIASNEC